MGTTENKSLLQHVFAETAKGNGRPFVDALADDVKWRIIGTTGWSRTYSGKSAVLKELLSPLNAQLEGANTIVASRFIAEDDMVVVEGRGKNKTRTGQPYDNEYCWVIRMSEGKMAEITEYTDTHLIELALSAPTAAR